MKLRLQDYNLNGRPFTYTYDTKEGYVQEHRGLNGEQILQAIDNIDSQIVKARTEIQEIRAMEGENRFAKKRSIDYWNWKLSLLHTHRQVLVDDLWEREEERRTQEIAKAAPRNVVLVPNGDE